MLWSDVNKALGQKQSSVNDFEFDNLSTDSRTIGQGDVFLALQGPNFDGHDYIASVFQKGARACIVSNQSAVPENMPHICVANTRDAYTKIAQSCRLSHDGIFIGITGSVGKTTTKEMLLSVLSLKGDVLGNAKNENNEIGVPKTLLKLKPQHRFSLIEMGACFAGDIDTLCDSAHPTIGVVTACCPAHIENYPSLECIAKEKGQLLVRLPKNGTAIINEDDRFAEYWKSIATPKKVITFGLSESADVGASKIYLETTKAHFTLSYQGHTADIYLMVPGQHMVMNALAAAASAFATGCDIQTVARGLNAYKTASGRMMWCQNAQGVQILDDAYNANPTSVAAAIEVLALQPGETWLVLGDMAELGTSSAEAHRTIGCLAKDKNIKHVFGFGPLTLETTHAFGEGAMHFMDRDKLIAHLQNTLHPDVHLLIKGSFVMGMQKVVSALMDMETQG